MITEVLTVVIGTMFGTITGLIPGMHINLLSTIILSFGAQYFFEHTMIPAIFILSTGIAQNFSEAIQTTFLNTPTAETALLPAQQLLKEGKGHQAIQHFITGALFGTITSILLSPALFTIIPLAYQQLKNFTPLLLATVIAVLIIKEKSWKQKIWATTIVVLAGIFGRTVLTSNAQQPLFLMLSSLFGTSSILMSLMHKTSIPEQKAEETRIKTTSTIKASTGAALSLMLTTLLPGIGTTQASILPSTLMKVNGKNYITLLGSIGTADFIISLITFITINKARNGAIASISQLIQVSTSTIITLFSTALITAGIATITSFYTARKATKVFNKINHSKISIVMVAFLFTIGWLFAGSYGILTMTVGTAIGTIPQIKNTARSHAMSSLILPIILNNIF